MRHILLFIMIAAAGTLGGCQTQQAVSDASYSIQERTLFIRVTKAQADIDVSSEDLKSIERIKVQANQPRTTLLLRVVDEQPARLLAIMDAPESCIVFIMLPDGIIFGQQDHVDV
jgi:filamentous hemagglutinin family protein